MKLSKIGKLKKLGNWAIFILIILSTLLYSFIHWQKHIHFQTFGWDTSVFDQQVYLAGKFMEPYSSLMKMNELGDHFHPLVLLFGGILYAFWSDPRSLFILESLLVCLSAFPLYLLSMHLFKKSALPQWGIIVVSLSLCMMYLFSVPFQAMVLDEFHEDPLVSLPIIFMIYFLVTKKSLSFWIAYLFVLLTKEEYGLWGISLGIYIVLLTKEFKKGLLTAAIGISVFFLLIFYVMPAFSKSSQYAHFRNENKPTFIIQKLIGDPTLVLTELIDHPKKRETIKVSLLSYGLLPLLSPVNLILPLTSIGIRFYDTTTVRRYEFNNHYASPLIPFLAIASAFGLFNAFSYLTKRKKIKMSILAPLIVVFIATVSIGQDILFHGPINSIFKKSFYETQNWEYDAQELINRVPKEEVIATQNSLLPHLSQRKSFFLLPEIGDAKFIAVDLEDGPNKFAPVLHDDIKKLVQGLIDDNAFEVVWKKNNALLLKKKIILPS